MNRMLSIAYRDKIFPFGVGVATMSLLVAAVSYSNPALRCINENGTVYVSAPVSKCYQIDQFMPAGALGTAR